MDWDATLQPLLETLGLDLYDVEFPREPLTCRLTGRGSGPRIPHEGQSHLSEWLDANDPSRVVSRSTSRARDWSVGCARPFTFRARSANW